MEPIKLINGPMADYLAYKEDIRAAVDRVLESGWYILGSETATFEKDFAGYLGLGHGIGVGSGTEALHLCLLSCGIGQGDEVVTVSHTAVATVAAIEMCGATPVLVDIDSESYTIDPAELEKAITKKLRLSSLCISMGTLQT
jgi:Predicted pyridoxal phosphate-dependent enzyme apparently involved in regulation of cell wall biogenesis